MIIRVQDYSIPQADPETFIAAPLPVAYYDRAEKYLLRAVLEDAIMTLFRTQGKTDGSNKKAALETVAWFASDVLIGEHYFPFRQVCEELEMDPHRLRSQLAARLALGPRPRKRAA